jgi:hypothetical protein
VAENHFHFGIVSGTVTVNGRTITGILRLACAPGGKLLYHGINCQLVRNAHFFCRGACALRLRSFETYKLLIRSEHEIYQETA